MIKIGNLGRLITMMNLFMVEKSSIITFCAKAIEHDRCSILMYLCGYLSRDEFLTNEISSAYHANHNECSRSLVEFYHQVVAPY